MTNSYLAIVDIHGLRTICPEKENTQRRLMLQLGCHHQPAGSLVWAVLDIETITFLQILIVADRRAEAWYLLQHSAERLGRISLSRSPEHYAVQI